MARKGITDQTRAAGFQAVLPFVDSTKERVLEAVRASRGGLTAEEAHAVVGGTLNNTRSRLTELYKDKRLVVVGKRPSLTSGVRIAVYDMPPGDA